ncbi:hypothetical protein PT015_10160 [Candidatus Mycobacterium wuenschmannii]|uniref:Uncharacterized protein n=1 Tax=Candidatus Mycobacterium wuenschmannii TaxID=3027808 RepID=A0ABY8W1J9_9MYCO|nr:hypothetical protein [Candidatus Mycobacterium wuenschmannii]WIM89750.1 hypothetical protein PT015_10160 [Candidatus Mycobacterium wuenschmannii]
MVDPMLVKTDSQGRIVLRGHPNQRFLVHENSDGSLLLRPVDVDATAQGEFDSDPESQMLLARAAASSTIRRVRRRR